MRLLLLGECAQTWRVNVQLPLQLKVSELRAIWRCSAAARAGFELSQIKDSYAAIESDQGVSLDAQGWETSPYLVFLRTIPGRFYPIAMLALQAMLILTQRDFGTMFAAERRVLRSGKVHADDADPEQARPPRHSPPLCSPAAHLQPLSVRAPPVQVKINPELESKGDLPPRLWNALLPICSVVILVFLGLILTGVDATDADPELSSSIENIFGQGDTYSALLWSTFAVSLATWALLRMQYYAGDRIYWFWQRGKRKEAGAQPLMTFKGAPPSLPPPARYPLLRGSACSLAGSAGARAAKRQSARQTAARRVGGHVAGGHQAARGHDARAHPRVGHRRRYEDARHGRLYCGGCLGGDRRTRDSRPRLHPLRPHLALHRHELGHHGHHVPCGHAGRVPQQAHRRGPHALHHRQHPLWQRLWRPRHAHLRHHHPLLPRHAVCTPL